MELQKQFDNTLKELESALKDIQVASDELNDIIEGDKEILNSGEH